MSLHVKKRNPFASSSDLTQRILKRERRQKTIRRIVISVAVIAILCIGGALAYTWYMGQNQIVKLQAPPEHKKRVVFKAPKVSNTSRVGIAVQTITSPVKRGANASLSIRTNPLADCTITVQYNKVASKDSGLVKKKADEFGTLSWAWTVTRDTPTGTWPVKVLCKNKKYSGEVSTNLVVK